MNLESLSSEELSYISESEMAELERLLALTPHNQLDLHQLWRLMALVWDALQCDNKNLDLHKISNYYRHPVWLLNGLFIENHQLSLEHRQAIVNWISKYPQISKVLDYGGGSGTLDRMLLKALPSLHIEIYEPFPSEYALKKSACFKGIKFIDKVTSHYDCLICTDVLEHVSAPIKLLSEMIGFVNIGGYLLIANHFFPSIKCHLPCTFHLRYTFDEFANLMGLEKVGDIQNGYINIYHKKHNREIDWIALKEKESQSRKMFKFNSFMYEFIPRCIGKAKQIFRASILKIMG